MYSGAGHGNLSSSILPATIMVFIAAQSVLHNIATVCICTASGATVNSDHAADAANVY